MSKPTMLDEQALADLKDGEAMRLLETAAALKFLAVACKSEPELGLHWRVKLVDKWYYDAGEEHAGETFAEAADKCRAALS